MVVSGDRKIFGISALLFHIFPTLVQGFIITYDETFQALAAEGDVLLPKPFLDIGCDSVVRWKSPASDIIFSLPNT
jgi:hypothetical protein